MIPYNLSPNPPQTPCAGQFQMRTGGGRFLGLASSLAGRDSFLPLWFAIHLFWNSMYDRIHAGRSFGCDASVTALVRNKDDFVGLPTSFGGDGRSSAWTWTSWLVVFTGTVVMRIKENMESSAKRIHIHSNNIERRGIFWGKTIDAFILSSIRW